MWSSLEPVCRERYTNMLCVVILALSATPLFAADLKRPCSNDQVACRDGSCIPLAHKCDGTVHCRDRSDESHAFCWDNKCTADQFRCTYGACVNRTAPCNDNPECDDYSDELLPKCRNNNREIGDKFKCSDSTLISPSSRCDGVKDCPDGSDETLWTCAGMVCPRYLFQCAYGACVDNGAACDQVQDCADGSDEEVALCENFQKPKDQSSNLNRNANCVLPPYPTNGIYVSQPEAKPGDTLEFAAINVTCRRGYGVNGPNSAYCYHGWWPEDIPKCTLQCHLPQQPSVEYICISGSVEGDRPCNEYEFTGTVARPRCRAPNYYSPKALLDMRCVDGSWTNIAKCNPECGTPAPKPLLHTAGSGGRAAVLGEVPWHAGIYTKSTAPLKQICGGTLVSMDTIISAAHCFWNNEEGKKLPAANYAVAVGKLYRPWSNKKDEAQRSDVKEVHLPVRFQGSTANYQDDIAIVIVATPFEYKSIVRPVCVDFDINFDRIQLRPDRRHGKVAGWGLTNVTSEDASPFLTVLELPYVDLETCISTSPQAFRPYITSDKFCAGFKGSNKAVCQGDSGGGLVFPDREEGMDRYYLRGIVSTAPSPDDENTCNDNTYTAFTHLQRHEHFIKQFWNPSL